MPVSGWKLQRMLVLLCSLQNEMRYFVYLNPENKIHNSVLIFHSYETMRMFSVLCDYTEYNFLYCLLINSRPKSTNSIFRSVCLGCSGRLEASIRALFSRHSPEARMFAAQCVLDTNGRTSQGPEIKFNKLCKHADTCSLLLRVHTWAAPGEDRRCCCLIRGGGVSCVRQLSPKQLSARHWALHICLCVNQAMLVISSHRTGQDSSPAEGSFWVSHFWINYWISLTLTCPSCDKHLRGAASAWQHHWVWSSLSTTIRGV